MATKPKEFKRLNRVVGVAEALAGTLDPVLKKRGFASRDLVTHWAAIAPAPYDGFSRPDKLTWPRGEKRAEGATLHLRCAPSHRLGLAHEGPRVAAAINSYFGFLLVGDVRISLAPFEREPSSTATPAPPSALAARKAAEAVAGVADEGLRAALEQLGKGVLARRK